MKKVTKYISRKTLLYKTGVEYGDYTINHVQGCSHGCKYPCYAFLMAKRFGKARTYEEWIEPQVVHNTLSLLEEEIPKLKSKIISVHLCFTTDPFMFDYPEISMLSMDIIKMLNSAGIKCTALTKGLLPKELTELSRRNEYGITLISLNEDYRKEYEPNSATYRQRIERLYYLHEKGYKTWVSIEPYPTPNIVDQNFSEVLKSVTFVDKIIFGRLNYNPKVREYKDYRAFYNLLSQQVVDFCQFRNIEYHIKNGTMSEKESRNTAAI
ncbi:MAG: radical SAM protein [Desulfitibacter sp. BRH_c19]|nr:MAG: radical SAM protein [Desulfitibacter sp. BRH_c19]